MGKVIRSVVKPITSGLSSEVSPVIAKKKYWDIEKEVKPAQEDYAKVLERSKALSAAASPARAEVLRAMGEAAAGRGPSLAEAQLKAAQDRTLAQQLAATQAGRGGGALAQRSLVQAMGASGRDLAQQAAIARLQERADFMNQAGAAEAGLRQDIGGSLNLALMPKQSLQAWEMGRVGAVNAAQQANAAAQNQMMGSILSGAATIGAGALGGAAKTAGGAAGGAAGAGGGVGAGGNIQYASDSPFKDGGLVEKLTTEQRKKRETEDQVVEKKQFEPSEEEKKRMLMEKFKKAAEKKAEGGQVKKDDEIENEQRWLRQEKQRQESDVLAEEPEISEEEHERVMKEKFKRAATKKACGGKVKGYESGGTVGWHGGRTQKEITSDIEKERESLKQSNQGGYTENPDAERKFIEALAESRRKWLKKEAEMSRTPASVPPELQGYKQRFPKVQNKQDGGAVDGPGTETSDSIPAMLSDGEFVIRAKEVKKPGILEHLKKLNDGKLTEKDLSKLAKALATHKRK